MLNSCACAGVTRYNKSDENRINCYRQLMGIFLSLSSHIFLKIPLAAYLLMVTKMLTGEWWSISTGENFEGLILFRSHQSFALAETISSLKFVSVLQRNCENWTVSETVKKLYKRNCLLHLKHFRKKVIFWSNQPSLFTSGFLFPWFDSDCSWSFFGTPPF